MPEDHVSLHSTQNQLQVERNRRGVIARDLTSPTVQRVPSQASSPVQQDITAPVRLDGRQERRHRPSVCRIERGTRGACSPFPPAFPASTSNKPLTRRAWLASTSTLKIRGSSFHLFINLFCEPLCVQASSIAFCCSYIVPCRVVLLLVAIYQLGLNRFHHHHPGPLLPG